MKAVVCDDDPTLRGVVSNLATASGMTVLAETDSATDAVDLVERFGAEVLLLDLALRWGSGVEAIIELRNRRSPCQVVVFTSYASSDPAVRDARVRAVVEKPNFDRLEAVLRDLAGHRDSDEGHTGGERRKPASERAKWPRAASASPSGLEDVDSFTAALEATQPGDAVLVVHVGGIEAPAHRHGRMLQADRLLAVARSLRLVLRVQDRMALGEDDRELIAILLAAGRPGIEAVWQRLERAHELSGGPGVLSGGWAVVQGTEAPTSSPARARDAAHRSIGRPSGERLWAG